MTERAPLLVLSLFPGVDLLGLAFEQEGFCVVQGPEWMFGRDVRDFHVPHGKFDLVIGGPPCQSHSSALEMSPTRSSEHVDLIPEFVRIVRESGARAVVMENVTNVMHRGHDAIPPEWTPTQINDWNCGGITSRTRAFWTWPMTIMSAPKRPQDRTGVQGVDYPWPLVMASTYRRGAHSHPSNVAKGFLGGDFPLPFYGDLMGADIVRARLAEVGGAKARQMIIHMLGNGVPLAMGRHVARQVKHAMEYVP